MASITSANSILMLSISALYAVPQQIQGYSVDDIYDTEPLEVAETMMGVDGFLSGGFVNSPVRQGINLQADSGSMAIFENWYNSQKSIQDLYYANATITLPSLGKKWQMTRGILTTYPLLPDAKKVLQPRKMAITWQSILPAPL